MNKFPIWGDIPIISFDNHVRLDRTSYEWLEYKFALILLIGNILYLRLSSKLLK